MHYGRYDPAIARRFGLGGIDLTHSGMSLQRRSLIRVFGRTGEINQTVSIDAEHTELYSTAF